MDTPVPRQPSLFHKMQTVLDVVLDIEKTNNETDACLAAAGSLEKLRYPFYMISLLTIVEGERFIVAQGDFAGGQKWKDAVGATKRSFDHPTDLLPLVLQRRESRFIPDSRNDPQKECDGVLCQQLNIVSQYVVPLATDSMLIGTLQVDMGERQQAPEDECTMLDALGAHLSIAVERHRALRELHQAQTDLTNRSKLIAYEAAAANILHHLNHAMREYIRRLKTAIQTPAIRCNKEALAFLERTLSTVGNWYKEVEERTFSLRKRDEPAVLSASETVAAVVSQWHAKAKLYSCSLRGGATVEGACVKGRTGALTELLTCLVVNAIEADARNIVVEVSRITAKDTSHAPKSCVEIAVSDDGVGIPETYKDDIRKFGFTTKLQGGHGMGMTIVGLLAKEMGGQFVVRALGRSAGEPRTEMVVTLPEAQ